MDARDAIASLDVKAMSGVWRARRMICSNAGTMVEGQMRARSRGHRERTEGPIMLDRTLLHGLGSRHCLVAGVVAVLLTIVAGVALAAQDKYSVKDPKGLAFADFRGYEGWQMVSVSQTPDLLKVMVANPIMIDAYRAGIPGNGKSFPDGSKIAKIEYRFKKSTEAP
jgi:hypothetical protein